jgi:hypothetical protein
LLQNALAGAIDRGMGHRKILPHQVVKEPRRQLNRAGLVFGKRHNAKNL